MTRTLLGLLLVASTACYAHADPILLARFTLRVGVASDEVSDPQEVVSAAIEFGYHGLLSGNACAAPRIGCAPIAVGNLVAGRVIDYYPSNSPHFSYVASRLIDGSDQSLFSVVRTFGSGGVLPLSVGASNLESAWLQRSPDLAGQAVTLIRMRVNRFSVTAGCCGGTEFTADVDWEFYGGDITTATAVSRVSGTARGGRAIVEWSLAEPRGTIAVLRRQGEEAWRHEADLDSNEGTYRFEDRDVVAGEVYRYGIALGSADAQNPIGQVEVAMPALLGLRLDRLRLLGGTELAIDFSLGMEAPARLELFDVSGRIVASRVIVDFARGPHREVLGTAALPSGIYWLRLRQGAQQARRSVLIRR